MATIETKYSVGDKVWFAGTTTEAKQHPCPDCNDTRRWSAASPAGYEYTFACPRCTANYAAKDGLSLKYTAHVPTARCLTIGSVRFDSKPYGEEAKTQYMCQETGVGSGQIYDENRLFQWESEAMQVATLLAQTANETVPRIVERFNKTLEISDYQLDSGLIKLASDADSKARSMLWNLNDLFAAIEEADDKDAILEAVTEYKEWSWKRDLEAAAEPVA